MTITSDYNEHDNNDYNEHDDNNNINQNIDDEYEIDELITLYKSTDAKYPPISDTNIIKMICHYFSPSVEIIENKYVTNVKSNLWSKHDDICEFLMQYKETNTNNDNKEKQLEQQLFSFDDLYEGYKSYFKAKGIVEQKTLPIVSKQFFEKFVSNQLTPYIKFDKFVSCEWFNT